VRDEAGAVEDISEAATSAAANPLQLRNIGIILTVIADQQKDPKIGFTMSQQTEKRSKLLGSSKF
jgi:hypothetical protein